MRIRTPGLKDNSYPRNCNTGTLDARMGFRRASGCAKPEENPLGIQEEHSDKAEREGVCGQQEAVAHLSFTEDIKCGAGECDCNKQIKKFYMYTV